MAVSDIVGVKVRGGVEYRADAVILTTGTFLSALMHTGEAKTAGGRAGEGTTTGISGALNRLSFQLARFKTGTPPRLNGRTIDYSKTEIQPGDDNPQPFSFLTDNFSVEQIPCWITFTNPDVHQLIQDNLHRAPMYSGQIQGSGPRYCPRSKTKSSNSRTKIGINCSSNPKAGTRWKFTSTEFPPACLAMYRIRCSN